MTLEGRRGVQISVQHGKRWRSRELAKPGEVQVEGSGRPAKAGGWSGNQPGTGKEVDKETMSQERGSVVVKARV